MLSEAWIGHTKMCLYNLNLQLKMNLEVAKRSSFRLEVIVLYRYKECILYLLAVRAKNWENANHSKKLNSEKSA